MVDFMGTLLENALDWLGRLRSALLMMLAVTAASFVAASVLAIGLELARQSPFKAARWATRSSIDFVRCVPILTILYFLYFGLPGVSITLSSFVAGTVGLALVYSTYIAEVLRGGVSAIHAADDVPPCRPAAGASRDGGAAAGDVNLPAQGLVDLRAYRRQ